MKKKLITAGILSLLACVLCIQAAETVELPEWQTPRRGDSEKIDLGVGQVDRRGWGNYSPNERKYFNDVLPALFERTLVLETVGGDRGIQWVFTGPRAGFDISINGRKFTFCNRYYDSFGYNIVNSKVGKYPHYRFDRKEIDVDSEIKAITVSIDHKFSLTIALNGKEIISRTLLEDIRRHQIRLTGKDGEVRSSMLQPERCKVSVEVNPKKTRQTMLGWGGIATPTAYWELGKEGKKRWWEYVCEYNLLCQREYPAGGVLNEQMDNWDRKDVAKAHYYGDNFPNGEVSDFNYNKIIQELGGFVMFEFWDFPEWIGDDEDKYAAAMVKYCDIAKKRTGSPPRIVGVQNEVPMDEGKVKRFVPALRKALDKAGYQGVRIHSHNAPTLESSISRVARYVDNPEVWKVIDYGAANMYDYQQYFADPDRYDEKMQQWHELVKDKPFISTELCINSRHYQVDSYRMALAMGQLYHKNLTIADAVMICYCWTLMNTEQPSFGASRSLFVSSPENGFFPVPSSRQLRVFGAYTRRIKEGMQRCEVECDNPDLLVTAYKGSQGKGTLVAINRGLAPAEISLKWPLVKFTVAEIADPYYENHPMSLDRVMSGRNSYRIAPGMILTLTNVELNPTH